MASSPLESLRLKVQAPTLKKERDLAFYFVPPLLVAAVFAFCAYAPRDMLNFKRSSGVKMVAAQKKARVDMPDPNASLPEYELPAGSSNLLQGATAVKVSGAVEGAPALNAVDGSCADDANVAVAQATGSNPAWWQVDAPEGLAGQELVIYGGGSQSPAGKFVGGFSVDIAYEGGGKDSREFCKDGFALEGYETWKLDGTKKVRRIRVTARTPETPVVLREVQLIGSAE